MKTIMKISIMLMFISSVATAQPQRMDYAENFYEKRSYSKAVEVLELLYEKGENSPEVISKIAYSYKQMNQVVKAELWYRKLMQTEQYKAEDVFHYVNILKSLGKYEAADTWLRKYYELENRSHEGPMISDYLDKLMIKKEYYDISYLPINSPNSDFGTSYYLKNVVFASSRNEGNNSGIYEWNNQPFLDFYICKADDEGDLSFLNVFSKKINTDYHESSACFNESGNVMYLTRNNYSKGKATKSRKGEVNLKIYKAKKKDGEWKDETSLPFNSDNYSCGHPSLSADGSKLYFASDMPGGYGGTDIYVSNYVTGIWTTPKNLGKTINTSQNETFPFIHSNGKLYFASDGHPGLGSLDIFVAERVDGKFTEVKNLGLPINSSMDDFALIINEEGNSGYFSSNRYSDGMDDNIYKFHIRDFVLHGLVVDQYSEKIVSNATVKLFDADGNKIGETISDEDGHYQFIVNPENNYSLIANCSMYAESKSEIRDIGRPAEPEYIQDILIKSLDFSAKGIVTVQEVKKLIEGATITLVNLYDDKEEIVKTGSDGEFIFKLAPESSYLVNYEKDNFFSESRQYTTKGMEPGVIDMSEDLMELVLEKAIRLDNIYYDYGKDAIRPDAAIELNKLVKILKDNPAIVIELSSHTDSRGSDSFNEKLSDRRAKSAAKYIISQGIESSRIVGKGYGESKLINGCVNSIKCPEENHELNRRTEFKVIKMER